MNKLIVALIKRLIVMCFHRPFTLLSDESSFTLAAELHTSPTSLCEEMDLLFQLGCYQTERLLQILAVCFP